MSRPRSNVLGQRFGRLVVIGDAGVDRYDARRRLVRCRCDCGAKHVARLDNLGHSTRSCGCLSAELRAARRRLPVLAAEGRASA